MSARALKSPPINEPILSLHSASFGAWLDVRALIQAFGCNPVTGCPVLTSVRRKVATASAPATRPSDFPCSSGVAVTEKSTAMPSFSNRWVTEAGAFVFALPTFLFSASALVVLGPPICALDVKAVSKQKKEASSGLCMVRFKGRLILPGLTFGIGISLREMCLDFSCWVSAEECSLMNTRLHSFGSIKLANLSAYLSRPSTGFRQLRQYLSTASV